MVINSVGVVIWRWRRWLIWKMVELESGEGSCGGGDRIEEDGGGNWVEEEVKKLVIGMALVVEWCWRGAVIGDGGAGGVTLEWREGEQRGN